MHAHAKSSWLEKSWLGYNWLTNAFFCSIVSKFTIYKSKANQLCKCCIRYLVERGPCIGGHAPVKEGKVFWPGLAHCDWGTASSVVRGCGSGLLAEPAGYGGPLYHWACCSYGTWGIGISTRGPGAPPVLEMMRTGRGWPCVALTGASTLVQRRRVLIKPIRHCAL